MAQIGPVTHGAFCTVYKLNEVAAAPPAAKGGVLELPRPYLIFLGDDSGMHGRLAKHP